MTAPPVDAQRLRALLADAATPLPWACCDGPQGCQHRLYGPRLDPVADVITTRDAALIAAAVNALPALLAAYEAVMSAEIVVADSDACIRHLVLPFTEAGKQFRLVPSEAK